MMTGAPPRIPVGCGAFVSFHPSLGSVMRPSEARAGRPAGVFFDAQHVALRRAELPRRQVRAVRRRGRSEPARFPRPRRGLAARPDGRTVRRPQAVAAGSRPDGAHQRAAAADPVVALDEYYQQGYDLVTSPAAKRRSTSAASRNGPRALRPQRLRPAGLLARRLVEAGVPFITLYDGGWDHHPDIFNALRNRCPPSRPRRGADRRPGPARPVGATLVVALGEFGRTPQMNSDRGRDHWSNAMSVLFAGGGTPGGQVVGATDRRLRRRRTRAVARELRLDGLPQARHRPRQDPLHAARPAGAPGQRPDADRGIDVVTPT